MKIVNPEVEYWKQEDPVDHVAKVAHTCYHSPDRGHEANVKFYNNLIESKHYSPLRHCTYYYKIIVENEGNFEKYLLHFVSSPYVEIDFEDIDDFYTVFYVVTNGQFLYENEVFAKAIKSHEVSPDVFLKEKPEMMRYTFCCTTGIDITREYNRHTTSIMEESTRYCNFSKDKFGNEIAVSNSVGYDLTNCSTNSTYNITQQFESLGSYNGYNPDELFKAAFEFSEAIYMELINKGVKPEFARKVLPLGTKSIVIYTGSIKQWEHILQLRMLSTTGAAHPDAVKLGELIYQELQKLGYKFDENNNLIYEESK